MSGLRWLGTAVGVVGVAGILVVLAGQLGGLAGRMPDDLGVRDGRLKVPSRTPNSVHSQADLWPDHPMRSYASIAPLAFQGSGPEAGLATMAKLAAQVQGLPGARIVESRPDYLRATFTTRWLKFVDDAEFWLDPATGVVQVRSASRLGRKDFGVNRARVEMIRARLAAG
jgi:uncharacterized protein (DUF1499 family)